VAGVQAADFASLSFGGVAFHVVNEKPAEGFYFQFFPEACEVRLQRAGTRDKGLGVDFEKDFEHYKAQKLSPHKELLARAVNLDDHKKICDLTMGLAQDAGKLAYWGAEVTAVERDPVVAALVKNALERAKNVEKLKTFTIHFGEMRDFLAQPQTVDAYYLDPMFSHKRSALPKKEMQYLADLVEAPDDEEYRAPMELIRKTGRRLVVKRPKLAGPLCGLEPRHTLEGKMIRFDVY